jgi:secondary thiamine-phosphate synthase enzyme
MIQTIQVKTSTKTECIDITGSVQEAVKKTGVEDGICIIFIPHTTAAVTINENADPSVVQDIVMELNKWFPLRTNTGTWKGILRLISSPVWWDVPKSSSLNQVS